MKRITSALAMAVTLLGLSTQASAVPIQITGSELEVNGVGVGSYDYSDNSGILDLAEGQSSDFNFGHVDVIDQEDGCQILWWSVDCTLAAGELTLTVQLSSPILDGALSNLALFGIASQDNEGAVRVEWLGGPAYMGYSYGGSSGGILALEMFDLGSGLFDWDDFDGGIDLWGSISNVKSPVAVPEPGILLLLGSGLLATAGMRRRSKARS